MESMNKSKESGYESRLPELKDWFQRQPADSGRLTTRLTGGCGSESIKRFGLPPANGKHAKDFAVFLLQVGAEIEHSLLVQYLYAAYSINESVDQDTKNMGLQWKTAIRLVAREEMAHLVTVQNLLLAIKQPFHLNRASIHQEESKLAVPFKLERLTAKSLAKYVLTESPSDDQVPAAMKATVRKAEALLGDDHRHVGIPKVGIIYAALYWLFLESDDPGDEWPFSKDVVDCFTTEYGSGFHLAPDDLDTGNSYEDKAARPDEWGTFEKHARVDKGSPREQALASLVWIMAQGEGPNAIEDSHFSRFVKIFENFNERGSVARDVVIRVPDNPYVVKSWATSGTPIRAPQSKWWAELLNTRYQLMLLNVLDTLNSSRTAHGPDRQMFAAWAAIEMEFVKKIGQLLPYLPLDGDTTGHRAGAPFQTIALPSTPAGRKRTRQQLLTQALRLEGTPPSKAISNVDDATLAVESSLLDAISKHDDLMHRMF